VVTPAIFYYDKVASNEGVNGYNCDLQFDVAK
jgi:hypothetical protein